jgi:hypothetical protein
MAPPTDTHYTTPNTSAFYRDCIDHAVALTFDRMPDHSWRRHTSDHPLSWVFDHLTAVTTHTLVLRRHTMDFQNERWHADRHLELSLELRIAQSTYLLSVEIDHCYLSYFLERYQLAPEVVNNE